MWDNIQRVNPLYLVLQIMKSDKVYYSLQFNLVVPFSLGTNIKKIRDHLK